MPEDVSKQFRWSERAVWGTAVLLSMLVHLSVSFGPLLYKAWRSKPPKVSVPVTVKVVPKDVPLRQGELTGSFVPPDVQTALPEKKTAAPKPSKNKALAKKTQPAPPVAPEPVQDAQALPGQEEIVGATDAPFGVPDGVADGVVGIHGEKDLSADAQIITSSITLPEYTDGALDAGFEGLVVVSVYVEKDGRVTDAEIEKKVGFGMDERILATARAVRFIPRKNSKGEALATWTQIPFRFVIP